MTITLPTKLDLDVIYGSVNIARWADADNDNSPAAKNARITWAIGEAYRYVVGRLANRYDVTQWATLPDEVFSLIAKRGGIELYSSPRGLVDGDASTAMLNARSLEVESRIDQILAGQLVLMDASVESVPISQPGINNATARLPLDGLSCRHNVQRTGEPRIVSDFTNFYVEH